MSTLAPDSIPPDLLPELAQASTDLIQIGTLSNFTETFALDRANNGRARFPSEEAIEDRINGSQEQIRLAVRLGRGAAERFPLAFNESVRRALSDSRLATDDRVRFEEAVGAADGDYASATVALSDQIESLLDAADATGSLLPPVSGGDSLGCTLIAAGAMLAGATCVVGCGPCCVAGVAEALVYVSFCT
jgi:hypothetical protein